MAEFNRDQLGNYLLQMVSALFKIFHNLAFKVEQFAPEFMCPDNPLLAPFMKSGPADADYFADILCCNRFFNYRFLVHIF